MIGVFAYDLLTGIVCKHIICTHRTEIKLFFYAHFVESLSTYPTIELLYNNSDAQYVFSF